MVLLVCFEKDDTLEKIQKAIHKIFNLRIFEDPLTHKMNLNISQVEGAAFLCISQFTLAWDGSGGHRPGFERAMPPQKAEEFFNIFCTELTKLAPVEKGQFGADMLVSIENDGPVTISLQF
jgi:D-tyrosyl-tRNA(Tyr) deacylase